jgi:hypothetical protein
MRAYELTRKVAVGPLSIKLRIDADESQCDHCQEMADEIAMLVSTLATDDDEPLVLAEKIMNIFAPITSVEVTDDEGNGGVVRQ